MLTFSKKALAMPYSPIRKLIPLSDETAKRGIKIYRLNMGQPDLDSPEVALEAVRNNKLSIIRGEHFRRLNQYAVFKFCIHLCSPPKFKFDRIYIKLRIAR